MGVTWWMVNGRVVSGLPRTTYGLKRFWMGVARAARVVDTRPGTGGDTANLLGDKVQRWRGSRYRSRPLDLGPLILWLALHGEDG